MSNARLIRTNLVTALCTAAVTSTVWLVVFRGDIGTSPEDAEKKAAAREAREDLIIGPSGLAIPVAGITGSQLSDTYKQGRAGGSRVHDAIDIMADHGTPVVAAAPGKVEKLFFSKGGGGITVYVRSDDKKWIYYYAHLQDYAPGLKEGQKLKRGDPIGRVGSTGNANPQGPHLHFAIHRMGENDSWHGGTAVNPYPLLAGTEQRR